MKGVFRKLVVKKKNHKIEKRISSKEGTDVGLFARKQPIFSLPSNGNAVDALVDGEEALMEMAESIMMAKETIFITDWRIDPDLVMVRKQGHALNGKTLVELLLSASIRGVKIRILLYNSPFFMNITKGDQKKLILEQVHPSIECVSHRWNVAYAHHQKSMVVDHQIAFLGGIDLAKGRWDTHDHFINPHTYQNNSELFPQTDYYNSLIRDKDYNETPRLAWHDIHCKIQGPAVFDVEKNFVQRWNHNRKGSKEKLSLCKVPKVKGRMTVQIVRSICKEAGGLDGIERSVYESLLRVILRAKHYIYIEQQFFISNYGSERVWNLVVAMIADQIIKAFKKGDDFKAIFLVPMWSEGTLDSSIVQSIMQLFKKTMFMGSLSLFERLKQAGIQDVNKYVYINNIVSIGMTKSTGLTVAPIYVHSKCIIVDDRYVIIGSANINDRSLKGDRDTELAAVIVDSKKVLSQMDGKHFQANSFAFELRLRLWGEHMGIDDSTLMMLKDPIQTINTMWSPLANKNTLLLENAFPTYPRNSIKRFNNWYDNVYPSLKVDQSEIVDFKGHLVNMPLEFGIKECQLLSVGNSIVQ